MSESRHAEARDDVRVATEAIPSADGRGRPRLLVRTIEPTLVVRFVNAEILFDEDAIRSVGDQLNRLIAEGDHTRLVLNFRGVRYMSSDVLGLLTGFHRKVNPARGGIRLCGLDPLLSDMLRITHLDRLVEVCGDEAEALGLLTR